MVAMLRECIDRNGEEAALASPLSGRTGYGQQSLRQWMERHHSRQRSSEGDVSRTARASLSYSRLPEFAAAIHGLLAPRRREADTGRREHSRHRLWSVDG